MIHALKSIALVLLILFNFVGSSFAKDKMSIVSPVNSVEKFVLRNDTIGLKKSLIEINNEFVKFQSDYLGNLLIKATLKAEKNGSENLDLFYSLVRQYFINKGNRLKSLEFALKQYHELSKKENEEGLVWVLIDIGNLFYDEAEYTQAINFYSKAKKIALKKNNSDELAVIYMNFGMTYKNQDEYGYAIENFRKSSFHRLKSKNKRINAATIVQMAATFIDAKNIDSAFRYLNLSEKFYFDEKLGAIQVDEIPMYIDIERFRYFVLVGDLSKADYHFQKAQGLATKLNLEYDYFCNHFIRAKSFIDIGSSQEAINSIICTLDYFHQNNMIYDECIAYQYLGDLYFKLNDFKNASKYFKLFSVYTTKIRISDISKKKGMLRSIAEIYKSDIKLEKARKVLEVQKLQNNLRVRERNIAQLVSIFFVIAIFVLLFLFFNSKKNRKKLLKLHNHLKFQNLEIQSNSFELERSNLIKDKLFSIIAHDLRNPLNRLMSQLAIAQKDIQNKQLLVPMECTLKETINLFEGLLQWSRLDSKENIYSPKKVSVNENLNKIISFYLPEIESKNIQILNQTDSFFVLADQNVLQTIFRNIMSNSIATLGDLDGERMITLKSNLKQKNLLEIIIIDSGKGFDKETISAFKSDSLQNAKGLGLSLCKVLVKMSGWEMKISNHLHTSQAKVVLELPLYSEFSAKIDLNFEFEIDPEWKSKLAPLKEFKVYQNSQIRLVIKSFGVVEDEKVQLWIQKLLEAVQLGATKEFNELLIMLN